MNRLGITKSVLQRVCIVLSQDFSWALIILTVPAIKFSNLTYTFPSGISCPCTAYVSLLSRHDCLSSWEKTAEISVAWIFSKTIVKISLQLIVYKDHRRVFIAFDSFMRATGKMMTIKRKLRRNIFTPSAFSINTNGKA